MRPASLALFALALLAGLAADARACPFCEAQQPTLAQRRASSTVFALSDLVEVKNKQATFRLHKLLKGDGTKVADKPLAAGENVELPAPPEAKVGDLYVLIGTDAAVEGKPAGLEWAFERLDEASFAYVVRSPLVTQPAAERLKYFARHLEAATPLAAADAYLEFAHAPLSDVAQVVGELSRDKLRAWLVDPQVPERRKGLYGLLLGLVARESGREEDRAFLAGLVERPQGDFRAGFDGILGGYLWSAGEPGLDLVERKFLADPKAADGDVRHVVNALRFYWEHGRQIPADRLRGAMRRLLARPEFARAAIIDLARWQDWGALGRIVALYQDPAYADPATQRAIIGFVLTCPEAAAATELARLRKLDPARVAETERLFMVLGGVR